MLDNLCFFSVMADDQMGEEAETDDRRRGTCADRCFPTGFVHESLELWRLAWPMVGVSSDFRNRYKLCLHLVFLDFHYKFSFSLSLMSLSI